MTLQQLRQQIDRIDTQLLRLLNRRAALAVRVGQLKRRQGLRVFDATRERQILNRLVRSNKGPLPADAVRAIHREILRRNRRLEQSV